MTHVMEALYKNHKLFHNRMKVLENSVAILANTEFFDLHDLPKINGHDVDLDIPDKTIQNFLEVTNLRFQKITMTLTTMTWQSRCSQEHSSHIQKI